MSTAVVEKTFAILETLSGAEEPLALKELNLRTQLPKSTAYRILQTLHELGYVGQDISTGHYYITRRMAQLTWSTQYKAIIELATPMMQDMFNRFNETVNLGVLEGTNVSYLKVLETTKSLRWIVSPNSHDPFHCTALGRAIVAFLPEDERNRLISSAKLEARTEHTITSKRELKKRFEELRERGVVCEKEENDVGVACYAVPIFSGKRPIASLSISIPTVRLTDDLENSVIEALKEMHFSTSVEDRSKERLRTS